ncbi:hypothetical protein CWI36_0890p0010 [Hamiltosporidium magnivora]|uniref:Uncharacterized protein n=1 Tax=Hamiltosporidium magnivora TaxID=148818 RepID=A0A4V2JVD1_9MICR|nr:hypothetical protein CWI36_0890p0010 [Hamiltosporidium magnivora]
MFDIFYGSLLYIFYKEELDLFIIPYLIIMYMIKVLMSIYYFSPDNTLIAKTRFLIYINSFSTGLFAGIFLKLKFKISENFGGLDYVDSFIYSLLHVIISYLYTCAITFYDVDFNGKSLQYLKYCGFASIYFLYPFLSYYVFIQFLSPVFVCFLCIINYVLLTYQLNPRSTKEGKTDNSDLDTYFYFVWAIFGCYTFLVTVFTSIKWLGGIFENMNYN